jgi:hypothetical protein
VRKKQSTFEQVHQGSLELSVSLADEKAGSARPDGLRESVAASNSALKSQSKPLFDDNLIGPTKPSISMIPSSFLIDVLPLTNTNFEKRLNLTVYSQIFLNSVVWSGDEGQKPLSLC